MSSSPLLEIVRAGAFVMMTFSAILIFVVMRRVEAPVTFGTTIGPLLIGMALTLFALPVFGDIMVWPTWIAFGGPMRIVAALLLPLGLLLSQPLGRPGANGRRHPAHRESSDGPKD